MKPREIPRRGRGRNALRNGTPNKGRGVNNPMPVLRRRQPGNGGYAVVRGGPRQVAELRAPIANTAMVRRLPSAIDNMTFAHSELVTAIYGSVDYVVQELAFQPGIPTVFPWLSQLASLWDMYNVLSVRLRYVPACSTTTSGSILLGFDYDVTDAPPINKSAFMQMQDSCTAPSWSPCDLPLKRQSLLRRRNLFTRSGAFTGDQKTFDLGQILYATQGQVNDDIIGDLYIDYTIRMSMPQQIPEPLMGYIFLSGAQIVSPTTARPWGTSVTKSYEKSKVPIGVPGDDGTNSIYTIQRTGIYLVSALYTGTGIGAVAGSLAIGNTADFPDDTVQTVTTINNAGGTNVICQRVFNITERNWILFTLNTVTTVTEVYVLITQVEDFSDY